jgi:hypothetical protein
MSVSKLDRILMPASIFFGESVQRFEAADDRAEFYDNTESDRPPLLSATEPGGTASCGAREPVIARGPQVEPHEGWQASDHKRERTLVLPTQRQQLEQGPARAQASVEESDLLFQSGRPLVVAEETAV